MSIQGVRQDSKKSELDDIFCKLSKKHLKLWSTSLSILIAVRLLIKYSNYFKK